MIKKVGWLLLFMFVTFWLAIIFLWKSQIIATGQSISKNTMLVIDNLDLIVVNSKPFLSITANLKCDKDETLNVNATIYMVNGKSQTLQTKNTCKDGLQQIGLFNHGEIETFQKITKITLISSADLADYKITWHNAKP